MSRSIWSKVVAWGALGLMTTVMTVFCGGAAVFAADGAGWVSPTYTGQTDVPGGGGNNVGDGLSWIYYQATAPASDALFGSTYTEVLSSGMPQAIISGTCSNEGNGGFWHYGANMEASSWEGIDYFGQFSNLGILAGESKLYSTRAGGWGHWITFPYGVYNVDESTRGNLAHDIYDGNGNMIYTASMAAKTSDTVTAAGPNGPQSYTMLEMYNMAYQWMKGGGEEHANHFTEIPTGTYAFCWWSTMQKEGVYAISEVANGNYNSGVNEYDGTNPVDKEKGAQELSVGPVIMNLEDSKSGYVVFQHNLTATSTDKEIEYTVERSVTYTVDGLSGGEEGINGVEGLYKITPSTDQSAGDTGASTSGNVKTGNEKVRASDENGEYLDLYYGEPRNYDNGYNKFAVRNYYNVEFEKAGEYEFCETLTVPTDESGLLTKVCAKFSVSGTGDFYGRTNMAARSDGSGSSYSTTGIVAQGAGAIAAPAISLTLNEGDSTTVVFSHNAYSTQSGSETRWNISRSFPTTAADGSGYTYTSAGFASDTSKTNDVFGGQLMDNKYYTPVSMQDFYGGEGYILRDEVGVKFTAAGVYQFCETLYIDGQNTSSGCISIRVNKSKEECPGGNCQTAVSTADELCAKWTPRSYTTSNRLHGETTVISKVKNQTLTGGNEDIGWVSSENDDDAKYVDNGEIYVRPGDKTEWVNCYYAGVQTVAMTGVTTIHGEHGWGVCSSPNYNPPFSTVIQWNNRYEMSKWTSSTNTFNGAIPAKGVFAVGNKLIASASNIYTVQKGDTDTLRDDVGNSFWEKMTTGTPVVASVYEMNHSWVCGVRLVCNDVACWYVNVYGHHSNVYARKDYKPGPRTSTVRVHVPYNFINSTDVGTIPGTNGVVYAGNKIEVKTATVTVGTRKNEVVYKYNDNVIPYATQVDNAKVQLIGFVSDSNHEGDDARPNFESDGGCNLVNGMVTDNNRDYCRVEEEVSSTTLNPDGNLLGYVHGRNKEKIGGKSFADTYSVFDADAGKYMCFVMAVYPYRSGEEGNAMADKMLAASGSDSWYVSAPSCQQIAKKPSFEVWGGGVYSSGTIVTNTSQKANLYNLDGRSYVSGYGYIQKWSDAVSNSAWFGSWAEQDVTARGTVSNFASGAAIGFNGGNSVFGYTGKEQNYCSNWVPLSIANTVCSGDNGTTGSSNIQSSTNDMHAVVEYYGLQAREAGEVLADDDMGISGWWKVPSATGRDIRYVETNSANISGGTLGRRNTRVVDATGNVKINDNISYSGSYNMGGDVPKMIIYSGRDITIDCNVTRVDAILIANGTVKTANGECSNQLIINGVVIAMGMELNRTYGNTPGAYGGSTNKDAFTRGSGAPAEIINYDTTSLIWGAAMAGSEESDTLTTTYIHELAPRY